MNHNEPFIFYTERRLVSLTGLRARSLTELLAHVRDVPSAAIFFHTHHSYLSHHFETPVFSNDFANWTSEALREDALSERLAAIDLLAYSSIRDLRAAIVEVLEKGINDRNARREAPPGDEFYFCKSKSFIMRTGLVAHTPEELFEVLPHVSNLSLFYHFFEARLRLGRLTNDFSRWLAGRGEPELAKLLDVLDPYRTTLDKFRQVMIDASKTVLHAR